MNSSHKFKVLSVTQEIQTLSNETKLEAVLSEAEELMILLKLPIMERLVYDDR